MAEIVLKFASPVLYPKIRLASADPRNLSRWKADQRAMIMLTYSPLGSTSSATHWSKWADHAQCWLEKYDNFYDQNLCWWNQGGCMQEWPKLKVWVTLVIMCKNDVVVDNGFTLMHKTLTLNNESNVAMYRNCIKWDNFDNLVRTVELTPNRTNWKFAIVYNIQLAKLVDIQN